jgi:thiol-disulfide isomerase/thioredoxin
LIRENEEIAMSLSLIRWKLVLACALFAVASSTASAQDAVKWRTNYAEARKEAETKNLPVFIDFVRPDCFPCQKMDQQTFRDPRVVRTLNEKFIPIRINSADEPQLAAQLQISRFPTLVLADPDGRNRQDEVGFKEPELLQPMLDRVITRLTPTDAMQKDFANAQTWESAGEYSRAVSTLRTILADDKGRPVQKSAQALLEKIEKQAAAKIAHAKELQSKGQIAEALEALNDTQKQFSGLQASKDAIELIGQIERANVEVRNSQRNKRVQDLLTQAHDFYKTKDYIPCLDRCEIILANYGDLPEGQKAFMLASQIKNNTEWMQNATDVTADRLASMYLALADSYLKHAETRKAEAYLQKVIQMFPATRFAESAQIRLTQLQAAMPQSKVQSAGP